MSTDYLDTAADEIAKASDAAEDEAVEEQLRDRAEEIARLAQRGGTDDADVLDHHREALRSVSADAGGTVESHVVEANKQLGKFRDSIGRH